MDSQWGLLDQIGQWFISGSIFMCEELPDARAEMLALFEAAEVSRPAAILEFGRGGASLPGMVTTGDTDAIMKANRFRVSGEVDVLGDIPDGLPGVWVERDGDWVRLQFGDDPEDMYAVEKVREQIYAARDRQLGS